jgi:hypothetical protein
MSENKKLVIIAGGTGFIGSALVQTLLEFGYEVVILTRSAEREISRNGVRFIVWDGKTSNNWGSLANNAYAIINLAGDNISKGRWNKGKKQKILESRLDAGRAIMQVISQAKIKPKVLIQASAIGFYGDRDQEVLDENSHQGIGWLSSVAKKWEDSTKAVENMDVRRCVIRTAVVLGEGGFLKNYTTPFKLFFGGWIGNGMQFFSWIHIKDEVQAIKLLLENENLSGIFNLSAPNSVRNKEMSQWVGKALKKTCWFAFPAFLLRSVFGDLANELMLVSQRVIPTKLLDAGFNFQFEYIEWALLDVLRGKHD